jgi:hypothetical protein
MVLNMAQTWHQVRPGEVRNNCGGCHAHSQEPTDFNKTAAAKPDYTPFDLTRSGVKNVEYFRDIRPILDRSCVACHNRRFEDQMGRLALDEDSPVKMGNDRPMPETYARLARDNGEKSRWGYPPLIHNGSWRNQNASRYVRKFQSRRSLLVWKVFGRRTDGWTNDDFPSETIPGDPKSMKWRGQDVPDTAANRNRADLDYDGHPCPPPEAVAGTYAAPDGSKVKVAALSDEDRLTFVRWIDLGCPIDLDYDPAQPGRTGYGWMCDDQRPTLTVTWPRAGRNDSLSRILIGAWDAYSGLDEKSFSMTADFAIDGAAAGADLAAKLAPVGRGVWEIRFNRAIESLGRGTLVVSVKDRQGNVARVERTFWVGGG